MREQDKMLSIKRGYLKEDFVLFHLKDKRQLEFEFHYHDFNKIIIFLSGKVTYLIEGKAYELKPWDILFVGSSDVHKPIIDSSIVYERIVLWINLRFLQRNRDNQWDLSACFRKVSEEKHNLLRLKYDDMNRIKEDICELEKEFDSKEFGGTVLKRALFLKVVVYLNRFVLKGKNKEEIADIKYDENIDAVLDYINKNIEQDLSLDKISQEFYISKYYLMHKFKKQTGYTIHSYILQKRLMAANRLIKKGRPATEVYLECGFGDYSNFVRAFKFFFGLPPKQYYSVLTKESKE
jgi:AraC-like DNA-binding protein